MIGITKHELSVRDHLNTLVQAGVVVRRPKNARGYLPQIKTVKAVNLARIIRRSLY